MLANVGENSGNESGAFHKLLAKSCSIGVTLESVKEVYRRFFHRRVQRITSPQPREHPGTAASTPIVSDVVLQAAPPGERNCSDRWFLFFRLVDH
jgi:hypothetical protein